MHRVSRFHEINRPDPHAGVTCPGPEWRTRSGPVEVVFSPAAQKKKPDITQQQHSGMNLSPAIEAEVTGILDRYAAAYVKKDLAAFSRLFSPDITGYGSGPDEVIQNHRELLRQLRRDTAQADVHAVTFSDRKVNYDGRIAWITAKNAIIFSVGGGAKEILDGRMTMVLKNTGSRWVIEQLHFSMPYGGQAAGQSFPGA